MFALVSHDQLLLLLSQLLRVSPALLSPDVAAYLSEAVQDEALLRSLLQEGAAGGNASSHGVRSPNRKIISSLRGLSSSNNTLGSPITLRGAAQHASSSSFNTVSLNLDAQSEVEAAPQR